MNENGQWIWYYSIRTGELVETKYWAKIEYVEQRVRYGKTKTIKKIVGYKDEKSIRKRLDFCYIEPGELYNNKTGVYFLEPSIEEAMLLFRKELEAKIKKMERSRNLYTLYETMKVDGKES